LRDPKFGKYTEAELRDAVISQTNDQTGLVVPEKKIDRLIKTYRHTRCNATPTEIIVAIASDRMRMEAISVAERKAAGGPAPVYMYLFTWESPFMGGIYKSCHMLEMPFVFNNIEHIGLIGDGLDRDKLASAFSGAWLAFARTGNPDHAAIPHWPTYDKTKRVTMIFDTECRVENDPRCEERQAWEGII
jgi:para-nitrobenzyl esterase